MPLLALRDLPMYAKTRVPAAYYLTVAQKKRQEGAKAELDWPVSPCDLNTSIYNMRAFAATLPVALLALNLAAQAQVRLTLTALSMQSCHTMPG